MTSQSQHERNSHNATGVGFLTAFTGLTVLGTSATINAMDEYQQGEPHLSKKQKRTLRAMSTVGAGLSAFGLGVVLISATAGGLRLK
jgi:hypothetical protein